MKWKKWKSLSSESRKKLAVNRREQNKTEGILPLRASTRPIHEKKNQPIIEETSISRVDGWGGGVDVSVTEVLPSSPSNLPVIFVSHSTRIVLSL